MGIHLRSPIWEATGNRRLDVDYGSPIIAGMTVLPVLGPARARAAAVISGVAEVAPKEAADHFVEVVGRAVVEVETDIARLAEATKVARKSLKDAEAAAQRADVAHVEGVVAEILEDANRPVSFRHERDVEDLRDAIDDHGGDLDFDVAGLVAALDRHQKTLTDRQERLSVLRGLAADARRLIDVAQSPEVIRRVRDAGQEVAARAVVASLVSEMRAARQEAVNAVQRLDVALASLGALS